MRGETQRWPYSDLARLEVVALGCHCKLHDELSRLFRTKYGIEAFQLVEYFLLDPVRRNGNTPCWVFFPFIRRLLEQNVFHIDGEHSERIRVIPRTKDLRERLQIDSSGPQLQPRLYSLPFEQAIIGKDVFNIWLTHNALDQVQPQSWFRTYSSDDWIRHEHRIRQMPAEFRDILLIEFDLAARFWMNCADNVRTIVGAYPICSADTFYGYFAIVWPEPHSSRGESKPIRWGHVQCADIVKRLAEHAEDYYIPTVALLHNSIWESRLHDSILSGRSKDDLLRQIEDAPVGAWPVSGSDTIESGLARLWMYRKELLGRENGVAQFDDTLLFRKYNIASPGMVKQIGEIIRRARHLQQPAPGDKLPTALVYGEAGSGKDTMAKLIPLFTLPYWTAETGKSAQSKNTGGYFGLKPHVINVSALKPNSVFGPLFLGMNVSKPVCDIPSVLTLAGDECNALSPQSSDGDPAGHAARGVFVLDELNSLDIDLQGVLLRILENGEITPLFSIKPAHVRHLMIGIVNEDPEVLMRESETQRLKQIKQFTGEFIGNALYELLVKGRRLRPDLFYRFSRGLYIKLPSLRERREDIPILFYFECANAVQRELNGALHHSKMSKSAGKKPLPHKGGSIHVCVELRAYELLMHPSLDWPGNIRQLESVAVEVAAKAVSEYANDLPPQPSSIVHVSEDVVSKVLTKYFPNVFGSASDVTGGKDGQEQQRSSIVPRN